MVLSSALWGSVRCIPPPQLSQEFQAPGFLAQVIGHKGFQEHKALRQGLCRKPDPGRLADVAIVKPLKLFDGSPGKAVLIRFVGRTGFADDTALGQIEIHPMARCGIGFNPAGAAVAQVWAKAGKA